LDLDALEMFRAVATRGGVIRAAQFLCRVPSNVSTRIKQLEARLGVALFERQGRGLALTAEGRLLLDYAERLLQLGDEAVAAVTSGQPLGIFRLGAMESTAGARLPPLLARYHAAVPAVRVELQTGTSGALIARLLRHEIDAAFVAEPYSAPGLTGQDVFEEELVLISERGRPPVRAPGDLGRATLLAFAAGCAYRRVLEDWLASGGCLPGRVLEFASYPAIVACVAGGTGVALVPRSVLLSLRAGDEVQAHHLPPAIAYQRTRLLWHPGRASLALSAFRPLLPVLAERGT
jgi:DNA-binding transcriptional LysR family regulator